MATWENYKNKITKLSILKKLKLKKKKKGVNSQGFLKADAAPITTAKTIPRPAPREAPTAAAVKEDALA